MNDRQVNAILYGIRSATDRAHLDRAALGDALGIDETTTVRHEHETLNDLGTTVRDAMEYALRDWSDASVDTFLERVRDNVLEDLEAPVYTADLTGWLASDNRNVSYVDDAIMEYGQAGDVLHAIAWGWHAKASEIIAGIIDGVRDALESMEDSE